MHKDLYRKLPVKENPVCCNSENLGVAARLNPHDRSMEYMENGRFVPVLARTEKNCTLILKAGETVQWKYFQNWSIAKLENGRYTSLKLGAENFEDQILNLPLESGNYRILTSNRLPNGNMFANEYHFEIQPGETKEIELVLRKQIWRICWRIFPCRNLC